MAGVVSYLQYLYITQLVGCLIIACGLVQTIKQVRSQNKKRKYKGEEGASVDLTSYFMEGEPMGSVYVQPFPLLLETTVHVDARVRIITSRGSVTIK